MSQHKRAVVASSENHDEYTLRSYVTGFILSIYLTIMAYICVVQHLFSRKLLLFLLPTTALLQFLVQLVFFLHLGRETKPRWKLFVFLFMLLIVVILVAGSIWIMANLSYHMPTQAEVNKYLHSQDSL